MADALKPRLALALADKAAEASALALALALAPNDATADGPPIARLSCAMRGGGVMGGSDTGGIALSIATTF